MTPARVLELLRELRTLELMAHHLATFQCRADTRAAWDAVLVAIDDRVALLHGVLQLEADPAVVVACELALEQQARNEVQACSTPHVRDDDARDLDVVQTSRNSMSRPTIH